MEANRNDDAALEVGSETKRQFLELPQPKGRQLKRKKSQSRLLFLPEGTVY